MNILFFVFSILVMVIAHLCKVYRWKQFIKIYEKPKENILIRSLTLGYLVNYILPFRLGEFFRAWYSGRKMKNGVSFSLATIIVDRILDIISVGAIFVLIYLIGFEDNIIKESMHFYITMAIFISIFLFIALKLNKYIKIVVKKIASIFNTNIELGILKFTWSIITSFKDIIGKIKKLPLLFSTAMMWGLYMLSYSLFAFGLRSSGYEARLLDVFMSLFAKNNLDVSTINLVSAFGDKFIPVTIIYIVVPLLLLVIISFLVKNKNIDTKEETHNYLELLPHADANDRLLFLEAYFSGNSREYFKKYLQINRNISIIQDFSAGSNATTMLCSNNSETFFRKYSFGEDSEKLYEQIKWIKNHSDKLPLTNILKQNKSEDSCYYDMPYIKNAVGCFNFVHSEDMEKSWEVLKKVLDDLDSKLHTLNVRSADENSIKEYIDKKIFANIKKLEDGKYIKDLLKYDELIINGKKYKNLNQFNKYLNYDYLYNLFKDDMYSDIHGDMTIENIICLRNSEKDEENYYIIDPNTGNVHDSPCLDYGKLLQSLHGGYEFLMNTKGVDVFENNINYLRTKSVVYSELFKRYKEYLEQKFDAQKVKSIFFHEIVHWLRLLPYKIRKDGQRSVLFYAGFIIVLNEVIKFYGGDKDEK